MKLDEAIMKRASVRYFKDDPVSDEEIRALIEAAIRAPTASGLENWLFVVFKSEEVRKEIYDLIGEGMVEYYRAVNLPEEKIKKLMKRIYEEGMYRAPAYIAVFIDRRVRFLKGRSSTRSSSSGAWRARRWPSRTSCLRQWSSASGRCTSA